MSKINRFLHSIGFYHIGYEHKFLIIAHRIIEPFACLVDGVLGIILLPTPYIHQFHQKLLRSLIRYQMTKRIKIYDKQHGKDKG